MVESEASKKRSRQIVVPAEPAGELSPLISQLEDRFELLLWENGRTLPGDRESAVLIDLRTDALPDINPLKDTARPLVAVVGEDACSRLARLGGHPLFFVDEKWQPEFAAEYVAAALSSLSNLRGLYEVRLSKLKQELAGWAEDRGVELLLKENELARYKEFKSGIIRRLGDTDRGFIAEILQHTQQVVEHTADVESAPLRASVEALNKTAESLQGILTHDFWTRAEDALRGRSILVVSSQRKSRRVLKRGLIGTGAKVHGVNSVAEGLEVLREGRIDVMYVDWDNSAIIKQAQELQPELHTVLMTSELVFENAGQEMMDLPLSNLLITSDVGLGEAHDAILVRELTVTAGKLLSGDIFGLEKYLAWGTAIREAKVTGSNQRFDLMDRVGAYAERCGLRQSLCQNLETLVDELMMNAIWDAPMSEQGEPKYLHRSRQEPLELEPEEYALVRYGSDSNLLGISVSDRYGRLDRDLAVRYLVKCFARRDDQIDTKEGGAGLGLYYAFLSVSTFIINVAPGSRTEVIGLLDMNISPRELMVRPRSYLYFRSPVAAGPLF